MTRVTSFWLENDEPVGFLGLYAFGGQTIEIAGMVDPDARRRGIATALLEAALPTCHAHGGGSVLLVVPRQSRQDAPLRSTAAPSLNTRSTPLVLDQRPGDGAADPRISIRASTRDDFDDLSELLMSGFGHPAHPSHEFDRIGRQRTVIVELGPARDRGHRAPHA